QAPGINIDEQSMGIDSPVVTAENLGQDLFSQILNLFTLKGAHLGDANAVAGYQAQITQLNLELKSLGLIDPNDPAYNNPNVPPAAPQTYIAIFINVPDIVARLGNINVTADYLVGSGDLESPGDAQINIINNSPYYLRVHNLTIPTDQGGKITFNTAPVASS